MLLKSKRKRKKFSKNARLTKKFSSHPKSLRHFVDIDLWKFCNWSISKNYGWYKVSSPIFIGGLSSFLLPLRVGAKKTCGTKKNDWTYSRLFPMMFENADLMANSMSDDHWKRLFSLNCAFKLFLITFCIGLTIETLLKMLMVLIFQAAKSKSLTMR